MCCIVTYTLHTQCIHNIAGSGERRRIRENGGNKLVEFEATVSHCIYSIKDAHVTKLTFSRYQVAQGSLGIV